MLNQKVSIIVAIYNVERYVSKCIETIINQTYENLEIILVDDGSSDRSSDLCDSYARLDKRVRVIHKKNGGLSSARNAGLDIMTGEYVMLIDGDDYLSLDAVSSLMNILNSNLSKYKFIDILQYRYKEVGENDIVTSMERDNNIEFIDNPKLFYERLYEIGGEAASACSKLYNVAVFRNLRFREGILHEDEYMATRMLSLVRGIIYTSNIYYFYVMRDGSIIKSNFSPKKMDMFDVIEDRIRFLKEKHYNDLLQKEYKRYFISLVNEYCNAKDTGYENECSLILEKIRILLGKNLLSLEGSMKVIYSLCRVNENCIYLYYILRNVRKKGFYKRVGTAKN